MQAGVRFLLYALAVAVMLFWPLPQVRHVSFPEAGEKRGVVTVSLVAPKAAAPKAAAAQPEPKKAAPKPRPKPKPAPKPKPKPKPAPKPEPIPEPAAQKKAQPPAEKETTMPPKSAPSAATGSAAGRPGGSSAAAADTPESRYYAQVYATIAAEQHYPKKARLRREEGSVKVRFGIDRTGSILDVEIVSSSGHRTLDSAVRRLFRQVGAFAPPPPEMEAPLVMDITINYTLGE